MMDCQWGIQIQDPRPVEREQDEEEKAESDLHLDGNCGIRVDQLASRGVFQHGKGRSDDDTEDFEGEVESQRHTEAVEAGSEEKPDEDKLLLRVHEGVLFVFPRV